MPRTDLVQLRRDSSSNWESVNPTLAAGEIGYDTTTGWLKIGDDATAWNDLPYFSGQDMMLQISKGLVSGHSKLNKFGRNADIDTGTTPEDVWDQGGLWVAPTTARTHDIVSTSTADTSAGTGARTVTVYGLDASWAEQSETVTMNGTTNVATASTYTRIYRMIVATAGSGETNAGTITATAQTDATVTASIATGESQTLMAIYTVPAATTLYLTRVFASVVGGNQGGRVDLELKARAAADTATPSWQTKLVFGLDSTGTSAYERLYEPYPTFTEKTDIVLQCATVSASNISISGGFDGVLVDD